MENESRHHLTERETGLRRFLNQYIFVGPVGSLSCVVGLLCYALSSSFKSLFGEWNPTKIVLYIIFSSIITPVVFFAPECPESVVSMLKPHVKFLVLMFSSLYSFFAERSKEGKSDTWSVVSSVAFALTFLCLSRQIKPEFDVGLCGFFLGHVTGQLMKIHLIFILVAASFCYPLVFLESYSESPSRNGDSSAPLNNIRIDSRNSESFGMGQGGSSSSDPGNTNLEKLPEGVETSLNFGVLQDAVGALKRAIEYKKTHIMEQRNLSTEHVQELKKLLANSRDALENNQTKWFNFFLAPWSQWKLSTKAEHETHNP